jgi:hypothetical protein
MESTGAAMRILDLNFNVVVENEQMKELGGVDAEESELVKYYDKFCNPEVCGTGNCTLKQIVDEGNDEIRVEVEKEITTAESFLRNWLSGRSTMRKAMLSQSARRFEIFPTAKQLSVTSRKLSMTSKRLQKRWPRILKPSANRRPNNLSR